MSIKTVLKLGLSVAIIYLVLRSIDERMLLGVLRQAHPGWLLWAALWFVFSKVVGALRFNALLATENIRLSTAENLRLYWLGMYYNLLLPGGISGDGYKIKWLMDAFGAPFRRMFAVALLDRVGGVVALGQLCLLLAPGIPALSQYWWACLVCIAISVPITKLIYSKLGGELCRVWARTSLLSLTVQAAQLVATLGIVLALSAWSRWLEYAVLFLVSSVVAMLPLTIGGTGARELTFLWGAAFFQADAEKAVAIAFVFYLISTAVAFVGIAFSFDPDRKLMRVDNQ